MSIVVFVSNTKGKINKAGLEAICYAADMAKTTGDSVTAITAGSVEGDGGTVESLDCLDGSNVIIVRIKDSFKGESTDVENTFNFENGKLSVVFDYDFRDEGRYEVVIYNEDSTDVAYRGIFIATTQETQDYKLTNDKFYY